MYHIVFLFSASILSTVGDLGKSYVVWEEIFDNGLKGIYSTCWYLNYFYYGANDHWKEVCAYV